MWPEIRSDNDTVSRYSSSFALIALRSATALPPACHRILLSGIQSLAVVRGGPLLVAWGPYDGEWIFGEYPNFNGTVVVRQCTIAASNIIAAFSFVILVSLSLELTGTYFFGELLHVSSVSPAALISASTIRRAAAQNCRCVDVVVLCVRVCDTSITLVLGNFIHALPPSAPRSILLPNASTHVTALDIAVHNSMLSLGPSFFTITAGLNGPSFVQVSMVINCTSIIMSDSARLFSAMVSSDGDSIVMYQSVIDFRTVSLVQQVKHDDESFHTAAVRTQHLVGTALSFEACSFDVVFQGFTGTPPYPTERRRHPSDLFYPLDQQCAAVPRLNEHSPPVPPIYVLTE